MDKTMIETTAPAGELAALGVDSLAFRWILADMEEAFGFKMRGADIMKLKTLTSAVEFVEQHAGK